MIHIWRPETGNDANAAEGDRAQEYSLVRSSIGFLISAHASSLDGGCESFDSRPCSRCAKGDCAKKCSNAACGKARCDEGGWDARGNGLSETIVEDDGVYTVASERAFVVGE